jgi:ABC-type uncharacterized transport system auxiliary subunit
MRFPSRLNAALTAALVVLLGGVLAACGSARPIYYYSLDPPAVTPSAQKLDVSLIIGRVNAPLVYRDTRIIYRTGPNELGLYQEHRWAESPSELVQEMLVESLRRSGRYQSVQPLMSNAKVDYILRGRVERFEEVDNPLSSRVWLHFSLYDPKKGEVVWNQDYQQDQAVNGKQVADVAASLNQNLQQGILQITSGLDQYLTANPRPASTK